MFGTSLSPRDFKNLAIKFVSESSFWLIGIVIGDLVVEKDKDLLLDQAEVLEEECGEAEPAIEEEEDNEDW